MGEQGHEMSRRILLRGAALTGVAVPVLAACGGDTEDAGSTEPGAGAEGTTVSTSDVPVGGGTILADEEVVVTQPAEGEFKAFSAVCTHQGCIVQTVTDGRIICPCHGSQFSVEDGSVVTGPATSPLKSLSATIDGDTVTVS